MAKNFPVFSDLPIESQNEINKINGIASAQRTSFQAAYLVARAAYLNNIIIDTDASANILRCTGTAVPSTGVSGFAKGCEFTLTTAAASNNGKYVNVGTTTSSAWQQFTSA